MESSNLIELESYDWQEVFKYGHPSLVTKPDAVFSSQASTEPFRVPDVKRIIAKVDGENEGDDWVGVFELHDGRFVSIRACCDYTGWG